MKSDQANSGRVKMGRGEFGRPRNEVRAKMWKKRGGGGERRERLPANPSILKNPFAHERGF